MSVEINGRLGVRHVSPHALQRAIERGVTLEDLFRLSRADRVVQWGDIRFILNDDGSAVLAGIDGEHVRTVYRQTAEEHVLWREERLAEDVSYHPVLHEGSDDVWVPAEPIVPRRNGDRCCLCNRILRKEEGDP